VSQPEHIEGGKHMTMMSTISLAAGEVTWVNSITCLLVGCLSGAVRRGTGSSWWEIDQSN